MLNLILGFFDPLDASAISAESINDRLTRSQKNLDVMEVFRTWKKKVESRRHNKKSFADEMRTERGIFNRSAKTEEDANRFVAAKNDIIRKRTFFYQFLWLFNAQRVFSDLDLKVVFFSPAPFTLPNILNMCEYLEGKAPRCWDQIPEEKGAPVPDKEVYLLLSDLIENPVVWLTPRVERNADLAFNFGWPYEKLQKWQSEAKNSDRLVFISPTANNLNFNLDRLRHKKRKIVAQHWNLYNRKLLATCFQQLLSKGLQI